MMTPPLSIWAIPLFTLKVPVACPFSAICFSRRCLLESVRDILLPAPLRAKRREAVENAHLELFAPFGELLGVSYITYNSGLSLGAVVWGTETVGYHDGSFPALVSMKCNPLNQQPDKLLALDESFGRVLFDLLGALPEQVEPGDGCIGNLDALAPLG